MKLGVGTGNAHKLEEFRRILGPLLPDLELQPSGAPSPDETGSTFSENALIKARAAYEATGLPSIADDSGIEVDALGGAPGLYSQRYSPSGTDIDNLNLLLKNLDGIDNRRAAFVCAAAVVSERGEHVVEKRWTGTVAQAPSGEGGFGYDPIFLPDDAEVSAAELSPDQKDSRSHRGQAFRALAPHLHSLLAS